MGFVPIVAGLAAAGAGGNYLQQRKQDKSQLDDLRAIAMMGGGQNNPDGSPVNPLATLAATIKDPSLLRSIAEQTIKNTGPSEGVDLGPGHQFVDKRTGRVVASVPNTPPPPQGAASTVGKIFEDYQNGKIDTATFQALLAKEKAQPQAPRPPNDYAEGPGGTRVMVPGGSAAVDRAASLSKPVADEYKLYNDSASQLSTMSDLAGDTTGASDVALVYNFFKVQDPQSTVREGEFATVGEKMGLPAKIIGQINTLTSGKGFLTPDVRQSLVDTAGRSLKQRKKALQKNYNNTAKSLSELGVQRSAFLPFTVTDIDLEDVRKQFPDAQVDTAGRPYVTRNKKRVYIEEE